MKIETERCGRKRKAKKIEDGRRKRGFEVKFFRLTEHSSFEKGLFSKCYRPERMVEEEKNGETRPRVWLNGRMFFFRQRSEVKSSGKRPAEGSKTFSIEQHCTLEMRHFIFYPIPCTYSFNYYPFKFEI